MCWRRLWPGQDGPNEALTTINKAISIVEQNGGAFNQPELLRVSRRDTGALSERNGSGRKITDSQSRWPTGISTVLAASAPP